MEAMLCNRLRSISETPIQVSCSAATKTAKVKFHTDSQVQSSSATTIAPPRNSLVVYRFFLDLVIRHSANLAPSFETVLNSKTAWHTAQWWLISIGCLNLPSAHRECTLYCYTVIGRQLSETWLRLNYVWWVAEDMSVSNVTKDVVQQQKVHHACKRHHGFVGDVVVRLNCAWSVWVYLTLRIQKFMILICIDRGIVYVGDLFDRRKLGLSDICDDAFGVKTIELWFPFLD